MRTLMLAAVLLLAWSTSRAGETVNLPTKPCEDCQGVGTTEGGCEACGRRLAAAKEAAMEQLRAANPRMKHKELERAVAANPPPDTSDCPSCHGTRKVVWACAGCGGRGYQVLDAEGRASRQLTLSSPDTPQSLRLRLEAALASAQRDVVAAEEALARAKAKAAEIQAKLGQGPTAGPKGPAGSGLPPVGPNDKPRIKIEDNKGNRWELDPDKKKDAPPAPPPTPAN